MCQEAEDDKKGSTFEKVTKRIGMEYIRGKPRHLLQFSADGMSDGEDEDEDEGEFQNCVSISTRYKERRHDWRALGGEHVLHNLDAFTLPLKQSAISRYNREPGNTPRVREESDLLYIASVQPKSTPHRLPPKSSTLGLERLAAVSHCYAVKMGSHFQLPPMRNTRLVSAAMLALAPKHLPCAPVPTRPTSQAAASASSVRFNS